MWEYNYLMHYSSPYYDPAKASQYNHEYYEAHKRLKGRSSSGTKIPSLNEEGRDVARYVRSQVSEEKSAKLEAERQRYQKEQKLRSDAVSRTMEQHRKIMNERINSLQNLLKRMPDSQKAAQAPKIKALIYKLKEDNEKKRADIKAKYQSESKSASEKSSATRKAIREEAKTTYDQEYMRIANESRYQSTRKRR